jgi:uracil-DNA glycosylase family 4
MLTQGPICHDWGIRGYGDPTYGVVIVGIAPGEDEIKKSKRPFTGPSGQLLDACLKKVGWPRERIYATNTICHWNNTPTMSEVEGCGVRLRHELSMYKPKLIIATGAVPSEAILGVKRRKGQRGSVLWSSQWRAYVLDTHHPAYALHSKTGGMSAVQDILRDLSKIRRVLEWPMDGSVADVKINVVSSLAEAQWVMDNLPKDRPVTIDIETSNPDVEYIDTHRDSILCFAVAYYDDKNQETCYVFPEELFPACVRDGRHMAARRSSVACPNPNCPLGPQDLLLGIPTDVQWHGQGLQFDLPSIYNKLGVLLPLRGDTMLMSHCTDERPGYHGLKPNAREWLGSGFYEEAVKPFYKGKMHLLPKEELHVYNGKDAIYDLRLISVHRERMVADDTVRLYENILLPAMQTFVPQQIRGIRIDQDRLKELAYDNWFPRWLEMQRDLQLEAQSYGWSTDDINLNSPKQLRELFYVNLGQRVLKLTRGGAPALDKEVLDQLDHPYAAKLRAFRTLDGMVDRVFELWKHTAPDGCIHPMPYVTSTRTGRTAYQNPAAQTWPKDYTVGADYARIREVLVPHNTDTHCFIEADYNQVEVWLAQHESGDQTLLEHLRSGDVHSATAEGAFNTKRELHPELEWQEMRQNAKKIRFGLQYGEGAAGLSRPKPVGIGGTPQEAQVYINQFWKTYSTHYAWTKHIQNLAKTQGFLRTPTGRVMRFPIVFSHRELRQAINFPVQITASDYTLTSMIELDHPERSLLAEFNSWIVLNWHDCLVVECDRRYIPQVARLMRDIMQKPRVPGYPSIKVDLKVGDNLGQMKKYELAS